MSDADWDQESDYARYVLRGPSAEDLRHKADLDRKYLKEHPVLHCKHGVEINFGNGCKECRSG